MLLLPSCLFPALSYLMFTCLCSLFCHLSVVLTWLKTENSYTVSSLLVFSSYSYPSSFAHHGIGSIYSKQTWFFPSMYSDQFRQVNLCQEQHLKQPRMSQTIVSTPSGQMYKMCVGLSTACKQPHLAPQFPVTAYLPCLLQGLVLCK